MVTPKNLFLARTEYHLFLIINRILQCQDQYHVVYLLSEPHGKRLTLDLNLEIFKNAEFRRISTEIKLDEELPVNLVEEVQEWIRADFASINVFQEQDPFIIYVLRYFKRANFKGDIALFQDGLKPYNDLIGYSLGSIKVDLKFSKFLKLNNLPGFSIKEILTSKRYAAKSEINTVYLSYPDVYNNWNNKDVVRIEFVDHELLKRTVEKVFKWSDGLIKNKSEILLYLSQPTHSDGKEEVALIKRVVQKLNRPLVIKLHPLTSNEQIELFKTFGDKVELIQSQVPAEIFIMNIKNSILVSLNSTSFLYHTEGNSYYYTVKLMHQHIPRLKRYRMVEFISDHINFVETEDEINDGKTSRD